MARAHAVHLESSVEEEDATRIFASEMHPGAADEGAYPPFREVACAVCSANYTGG